MLSPQPNRREFLQKAAAGITGASLGATPLPMAHAAGGRPDGNCRCASPLTGAPAIAPSPASTKPIYGVLTDAARVPERFEYYQSLIDFCADWGLNAIQFRLADDPGCALRFESHPELLTHRNAFSPGQMRKLVEYGEKRGVSLIPEIESFGHTRYITSVPQYAELSDQGSQGRSGFTGIIPVHPKTLKIFRDLYRETAAIFVSPYIHGGCDEVNWGGSELSRQALETKTRTDIWAEYLNSLDEIARGSGKELIVWGDHVLRLEPEILGRLNKDVIVMDWNYKDDDPQFLRKLAQKVIDSGHRAMGAPAWGYCRWGPRAGTEQLRNLDAFADAYRDLNGSLGVMVTNWLPSRYLSDAIWDGFAYAAVALQEGSTAARNTAFRRFVEKHYAADWTDTWEDVFRTIYENAPYSPGCSSPWMQPQLIAPWHNEAELAATLKGGAADSPPYTRLRSQLVFCERTVRKNLEDFAAFALCAEYLEGLFWRNTSVVREAQRQSGDKESSTLLIKTLAERDRQLLERLDADWDRVRPSDSPAKLEAVLGFRPQDQLLFRFRQAAEFSAQLAADPDRFHRLLRGA